MSEHKIETVFVELDALLDTRLGTLAKLGQDLAVAALDGGYFTRMSDKFPGVDPAVFKQAYADRNTETLAYSKPTMLLSVLTQLTTTLSEQAKVRPYHDGTRVVVNTYPYQLTAEEVTEIGKAITVWINSAAPVELTYLSTKDLTPSYCRDHFSVMVVYEYDSWFVTHNEAFKRVRPNEVTMLAPALYFNQEPTEQELEQACAEAMHPLKAVELLASPVIDLKLLDSKYFSLMV